MGGEHREKKKKKCRNVPALGGSQGTTIVWVTHLGALSQTPSMDGFDILRLACPSFFVTNDRIRAIFAVRLGFVAILSIICGNHFLI